MSGTGVRPPAGIGDQRQQEVAVAAYFPRAAIREAKDHWILDKSGFQRPDALFNSHGSPLIRGSCRPKLRHSERRPPGGGAFRRVHEARLGGQQTILSGFVPERQADGSRDDTGGLPGCWLPQNSAARRVTFAHVAPPAPTAANVASRGEGAPNAKRCQRTRYARNATDITEYQAGRPSSAEESLAVSGSFNLTCEASTPRPQVHGRVS
jgi:hypothetical protein